MIQIVGRHLRPVLKCGALLAALVAVSVCAAQPAGPASSTAIPAQAFFSRPYIEAVRLSPSGRWLAVKTPMPSKRVGIAVFDLQTMKPLAIAAHFSDADIGDVEWVNDEMLVFDIQDNHLGGGDQRFWPGLYSVSRDGKSGLRQLVNTDGSFVTSARTVGRPPLAVNHELMHVPAGGGTEVIVGEYPYRRDSGPYNITAKRLDITTGLTTNLSYGTPANVRGWMFDAQGRPRLVLTRSESRVAYHWRDIDSGSWRVLADFAIYEAPWRPHSIDNAGALYVTVSGGSDGTRSLHRFDFATGKPAAEALVSTPGFDLAGGIVSETRGGAALGVRVTTDGETTVWFDERLKALQKEADQRLPGHINQITCRQCRDEDMTAVIHSWSDRDPGQYFIYRSIDKSWRKLGDARPAIDPKLMGTTDLERVRMRDGLEIPVWVTKPAGKAAGPRPAVLLVHGGPWSRGRTWRWSAEAQFLAARGYVVIEPEFRGSTGYGEKLYRAGWRQWGQAMQDDVQDALNWAVGKGLADKARACIAGGSYGGYATLMGLVRHPESYRCGVASMAVTDPRLMFQWSVVSDQLDEIRAHDYPTLIGDPQKDLAMIEAATPVLLAQRIQAPVMLVVGAQDRRVPLEHGQRMRAALTEAGKPPVWQAYADEGHGFFKAENRIDFMERMEAFLATHTRPR